MSPGPEAEQPPDERGEDALEALVAECCEHLDREGPGALDAFCREHPARAAEVRRTIEPLLQMGLFQVRTEPPLLRLGEFELLRELGRGGMGVVYEAVQQPLGRAVALKVMQAHLTLDTATIERFRREGQTTAALRHPGIVQVHTVGGEGNHHFIAMELVAGAPLDRILHGLRGRNPAELRGSDLRAAAAAARLRTADMAITPLPGARSYVAVVVELIAQVAEALEHAHAAGIVHRDVKPSNIIVRADSSPVLTDFGLARRDDLPALTRSGAFAGTPYYTAPEQARGEGDVDRRADVFALGATLYELLTLQRPFPGEDSAQVLQYILTREPRDPHHFHRGLAPDLGAVVLKALEKERERRYQTAAAFAADLRAFLAYRPVQARRASLLQRTRRLLARKPLVAALAVLLLVGVPTVAVLVGRWIADAPLVDAAERARHRERVEQALLRGYSALEEDLARADAALQEAQALQPDDVEALLGRGLVAMSREDPEAALRLLEGSPLRDRALQRLRAIALRQLGREQEAAAEFQRLGPPVEMLESFLEGWRDLDAALTGGRTSRLRPGFERLLAANLMARNARPAFLVSLADAASAVRDEVMARATASALTGNWPAWGDAWLGAGSALWHCDPDGAIAALRRAIELLPGEPRPRSNLAGVLFDCGRQEEALQELQSLVADHPGYARAHFRLGHALYRRGDLQGSVAPLRRAVQLDGRDPAAAHWLIVALLRTGAVDEAADRAQAATLAVPRHPLFWSDLAFARLKQGNVAAALLAAERSIAIDTGNADAWTILARAQAQSGDFAKARQSFERRLETMAAGEPKLQAREELIRFLLRPARGQPSLDLPAALAAARELDALTKHERPTTRHLLALALIQDGREAEAKPIVDATLDAIDKGLPCPPEIQQALRAIKADITR